MFVVDLVVWGYWCDYWLCCIVEFVEVWVWFVCVCECVVWKVWWFCVGLGWWDVGVCGCDVCGVVLCGCVGLVGSGCVLCDDGWYGLFVVCVGWGYGVFFLFCVGVFVVLFVGDWCEDEFFVWLF